MHGLKERGRILVGVIKDAGPLWLTVFVIVIAFVLGRLCSAESPKWIRYGGTLLEVGGLALVANDIRKTRRAFDRPSLGQKAKELWLNLKRVITGPEKRNITLHAEGLSMSLTGGAATLIHTLPPDATLERRLQVLEQKFDGFRKETVEGMGALRDDAGRIRESVKREATDRQAADAKVEGQLEDMATGGLHLETVGLVWLFLGMICTNLPEEIAWVFQRLWA